MSKSMFNIFSTLKIFEYHVFRAPLVAHQIKHYFQKDVNRNHHDLQNHNRKFQRCSWRYKHKDAKFASLSVSEESNLLRPYESYDCLHKKGCSTKKLRNVSYDWTFWRRWNVFVIRCRLVSMEEK